LTGAKIENLSPAAALDLQMALTVRGVVIVSTAANTPAAAYGFQPGDIVVSVNGAEIHSVAELVHALDSAGGHWGMVVERGAQRLTLSVDQ
jgi:serine protease Do